jgi:hypothetical protein
MARCQIFGAKITSQSRQISKLHRLIAPNAWYGRLTGGVGIYKVVNNRLPEPLFCINHVMRNSETVRDTLGIVDVLPRATSALFCGGTTLII